MTLAETTFLISSEQCLFCWLDRGVNQLNWEKKLFWFCDKMKTHVMSSFTLLLLPLGNQIALMSYVLRLFCQIESV